MFPGEPYLSHVPPDYESYRHDATIKMIFTIIVFICLIPWIVTSALKRRAVMYKLEYLEQQKKEKEKEKETHKDVKSAKKHHSSSKNKHQSKKKNFKNNHKSTKKNVDDEEDDEEEETTTIEEPVFPIWFSLIFMPLLNITCLCTLILIIIYSPNNKYSARAVFQAPMLTDSECQFVIDMAEKAASRNADLVRNNTNINTSVNLGNNDESLLLKEPTGWKKDRHQSYPTTDLNLVTDSFSQEDRLWLMEKMNARLGPMIERVFGIQQTALRANDMFVVRYDDTQRSSLEAHTDSAHISFNILLNDEFEGGGTRFTARHLNKYYTINPRKGEVLTHYSTVRHEGVAISKGTRYILVGFISVDAMNPITKKSNGLSIFNSWFSLNWLDVKFNEGYQAAHTRQSSKEGILDPDGVVALKNREGRIFDHWYFRSLFHDILAYSRSFLDRWSPHFAAVLVNSSEDKAKYLQVLDNAYYEESTLNKKSKGKVKLNRGIWFQGQQLTLDVDGEISDEWKDRYTASESTFDQFDEF